MSPAFLSRSPYKNLYLKLSCDGEMYTLVLLLLNEVLLLSDILLRVINVGTLFKSTMLPLEKVDLIL